MASAGGGGAGAKSSFDRLFLRGDAGRGDGDKPPSVHELFAASMRDEISLRQFEDALAQLHGLEITPAAARLLASVDGASGRLPFTEFQRAMAQAGSPSGDAGKPVMFEDQAKAIISDNSGAPAPAAPTASAKKQSSDISNDAFVMRQVQAEQKLAAKGEWSGGPVLRTNRVSEGNPLAARMGAPTGPLESREDTGEPRGMAMTATRMFVGGELDAAGYEKFIEKLGVKLSDESELRRLIAAHKQAGDGSFTKLSRALQAEMARSGAG